MVQIEVFSLGNSKLNAVKVSPFKVLAEVLQVTTSRNNAFINLWESIGKLYLRVSIQVAPCSIEFSTETRAIFLVHGKEVILIKTEHLDRESVNTMRESVSSKFSLPLREISSLNRRHCVTLLPFGQVVLVRGWVKTEHLSLHT